MENEEPKPSPEENPSQKPVNEAIETSTSKKSLSHEILRFIVIGLLCTLVDFGIQWIFNKYVFVGLSSNGSAAGPYLAYGFSASIAFFISNIVNFSFSRTWVFQNVDKSINTKSQKAWWTYFGLGAGGWLLGVALQEFGFWICNSAWSLNLSYDITKVSLWAGLTSLDQSTWAFVIVFGLKTCVTMVYNYLTRKHLIFKKPKEDPSVTESQQ